MPTELAVNWYETACPYCGKVNDTHASYDDTTKKPIHGDASLCIGCGNLGVFDAHNRNIRQASTIELKEFMSDRDIAMVVAAWTLTRDARPE
jgi:hypothetical protein